jgi:hypothetical protein
VFLDQACVQRVATTPTACHDSSLQTTVPTSHLTSCQLSQAQMGVICRCGCLTVIESASSRILHATEQYHHYGNNMLYCVSDLGTGDEWCGGPSLVAFAVAVRVSTSRLALKYSGIESHIHPTIEPTNPDTLHKLLPSTQRLVIAAPNNSVLASKPIYSRPHQTSEPATTARSSPGSWHKTRNS